MTSFYNKAGYRKHQFIEYRKNTVRPLALAGLIALSASAWADQECSLDLPATAPNDRFVIHDNGTVTDTQTNILWQRCALGKTFDGVSPEICTGSVTELNWQSALEAAADSDFADHDDWRLPNAKEIASVIEFRCHSPAVNLTVFPTLGAEGTTVGYWTSSVGPWGTGILRIDFGVGRIGSGLSTTSTGRAAQFVRDLD